MNDRQKLGKGRYRQHRVSMETLVQWLEERQTTPEGANDPEADMLLGAMKNYLARKSRGKGGVVATHALKDGPPRKVR